MSTYICKNCKKPFGEEEVSMDTKVINERTGYASQYNGFQAEHWNCPNCETENIAQLIFFPDGNRV